jgi:hypothetical protein
VLKIRENANIPSRSDSRTDSQRHSRCSGARKLPQIPIRADVHAAPAWHLQTGAAELRDRADRDQKRNFSVGDMLLRWSGCRPPTSECHEPVTYSLSCPYHDPVCCPFETDPLTAASGVVVLAVLCRATARVRLYAIICMSNSRQIKFGLIV